MLRYYFIPIFILSSSSILAINSRKADKVVTLSRVIRVSLFFLAVIIVVSAGSMLVGSRQVGTLPILKRLLAGWYEGDNSLLPMGKTIPFSIRMPRIIFAGIVGAS